MKIIGITGHKQVGKDTVLEYIQEHYHGYTYSFADPIYMMISVMIGELPKTEEGDVDKTAIIEPFGVTLRHMLQTLGTEWGRDQIHPNVWVMLAAQWLEAIDGEDLNPDYVIFPDIRFNNEADWVTKVGGTIIEVTRAGHKPDGHASEEGIDRKYINSTIRNNFTLELLYNGVDVILEDL